MKPVSRLPMQYDDYASDNNDRYDDTIYDQDKSDHEDNMVNITRHNSLSGIINSFFLRIRVMRSDWQQWNAGWQRHSKNMR